MVEPATPLQRETKISEFELRSVPSIRQMTSPPTHQAYRILQTGFTVAPIVAGLDKFSNLLVDWTQYLAPQVTNTLGISATNFMYGVGAVEVVAGLGVAFKPKIFAYLVSAWLGGIIINLLMTGQYYDIALRDLGLAMGAFALGRLSQHFDR